MGTDDIKVVESSGSDSLSTHCGPTRMRMCPQKWGLPQCKYNGLVKQKDPA